MSKSSEACSGQIEVSAGASSDLVFSPDRPSSSELHSPAGAQVPRERELFIDNLLVRIHLIIVIIRWTGLAPLEFEFTFPGRLISTFLECLHFTELCSGSEAGSYSRLIDFYVTQLQA